MKNGLISALIIISFFQGVSQDLQLIVPLGHARRVTMMDVSQDKSLMASIDGSSRVTLWDYASGKETYHLTSHEGAVNSIDFHPIKNILTSGSIDGTIRTWDEKGRLSTTIDAGYKVTSILFSSTGDSIFSIGNGPEVKIWNTNSGELIDAIDIKADDLITMALLGKHKQLIIGTKKGDVLFVNPEKGKTEKHLNISDQRIGNITYDQKSNKAFATSDGGEIISIELDNYAINKKVAFNIRNHKIIVHDEVIFACGRDTEENLKQFRLADLSPLTGSPQLEVDRNGEAFKFGLRALHKSSDTTFLIADYQQDIREWNIKSQQWETRSFSGKAAPVYDLAVNHDKTKLAIASRHETIKVLDLTGTNKDMMINGSTGGSRAVDYHPVNPVIATYGMDENIRVTNILSGAEVFSLKAKGEYSNTPVTFDPTGKYILRKSSENDFDFYDFKNKSPRNLKVKNGLDYAFSPDGRNLIFKTKDGLAFYDPIKLKETSILTIPEIQDFSVGISGELAILLSDDRTVLFYDKGLQKTGEMKLSADASSDKIYWTPGQEYLIGIKNSQKKGENQADFSIKQIDPKKGGLISTLPGHAGFVNSLLFLKDHLMFTSSVDGLIKIWNLDDRPNAYLGSIIPLQENEYVVTSPSGHFDATTGAMKQLHYVKNGEVIALDQLKSEYYEPNLLSKLIGYNQEPIKNVTDLSHLRLHPELAIEHPLKNGGKLGINLKDNGGGIGRIVILINGKEVSSDVRGVNNQADHSTLEVDYNITGHPFLYDDRVNKVTIKAYNEDGTLSSKEKSVYIFGEEKTTEKPKLYAVIAGTSDYKGESLDLKYAAKDATDFANAISLSGSQYLGPENIHVTLLTTDQDTSLWPTKKHIRQAFNKYSLEATAKDLLVVYISGHGVNQSGANGDFYYLTCDADHGDMNNTTLRENAGISSAEFTEYIKSVPALKQIMVIDACHSGRLASSLASSRSAMSSTQIRSLERMKDRTGLFVLAGSAADAVSYETTLFGQGLLTYSLLFGMKGAALRDDEFIDVMQLFQFAANKVPELAEEIGGIQKPEIRLPEEGKSFDIGRLSTQDRERIIIKSPKPVYVHSRFQDESAIFDRLGVGELLDNRLLEISKEKDPEVVFVDDKSFSGASTIHGRYFEKEGLLKAKIIVVRQNEVTLNFELEAVNAKVLADQVVHKIVEK